MKTLYQLRWWIGLLATNLMLLATIALLFSSCTSLYERAKARYMHQSTDTTFSTVTASVPAETLRTVFRTDTTHFIREIRQGRATVTIIREPTNTTVIANCDSASTSKRVATQIQKEEWSEDSKYKRWLIIALLVSAGLLGLLLMLILIGFIMWRLSSTYTLSKKDAAPPFNPGRL